MSDSIRKIELDVKDTCDNTWECYYSERCEEYPQQFFWKFFGRCGNYCSIVAMSSGIYFNVRGMTFSLECIQPILEAAKKACEVLKAEERE